MAASRMEEGRKGEGQTVRREEEKERCLESRGSREAVF